MSRRKKGGGNPAFLYYGQRGIFFVRNPTKKVWASIVIPRYIREIIAFIRDELDDQDRWVFDGDTIRHRHENIQILACSRVKIDGFIIPYDLSTVIGWKSKSMLETLMENATATLEEKWGMR